MDEVAKCYQVLGLKEGCSAAELEDAYQERAEAWQPENFSHNGQLLAKAREKLQHIQAAYETLRAHLSAAAPAPEPAPASEWPAEPEWRSARATADAFPAEPPASAIKRIAVWTAWGALALLLLGSAWLVFFRSTDDSAPASSSGQIPDASATNSGAVTNGVKPD